MMILLVSDCQTRATRLRHLLAQSGYDCPLANVLPLAAAESNASCFFPKPDVVLFVLTHDVERSQNALRRLHECSDVQILAVGPRDPNLILGALHAGATSYLDESSDLQEDLSNTLSRLSAAEHKQATVGRMTSVISASGGSGRTLLSANLAVALAKRHGQCGLFDFDLHGADAATYLNLRARHTIADLCRNVDKFDQKMFEQSMLAHESGVSLLAAPDAWEEAAQVTTDGLQKVLRFGRAIFSNIVLDMGDFWRSEFAYPLQQSTSVILLVRLDFAAIRSARRALACLDQHGVDRGRVLLVAARYGRPKEISMTQAETALGIKFRHYVPEDQQTANSCLNCGVPLVLESANSPIAKAVQMIADMVTATPLVTSNGHGKSNGNGHRSNHRSPGTLASKVRSFLGMSLQELTQEA